MAETEPRFIKVHTLSNRFEADVIAEALRQEGIPVILRSFMETPYSGLFVPQKGWGRIMVPEEMADNARRIISQLAEENEAIAGQPEGGPQVGPELWDALRRADPRDASSRSLVEYEPEEDVYIVPFLNTTVLCHPTAEETVVLERLAGLSGDFQLNVVILHYLLHSVDKPLANKWVSGKDLPSGGVFFTAAHSLPPESLREAFDAGPGLMDAVARHIGGEETAIGDLSYRFRVLPRIPILLVFRERDEEFESSLKILFDETIADHFRSLDLVWGLANVLTRALLDSAALNRTQGG
jgi:hypothetical protein